MRVTLRSILVTVTVAGVAFACGSSNDSMFPGDQTSAEAGVDQPPPGSFTGDDGGLGGPTTCKPLTCADVKANCGPIGDGCGGVVQCGTCDATIGDTCGGGGTASVCGKPACKPQTCTDLGANCGAAGDGCGGTIASCGTCNTAAGEFCGGGGLSKCGLGTGGGDGGADGGVACTPKTCTDLGANCGSQADGCGGLIASCGTCNAAIGETCGGAGVPSVCGKACVPKTTCPAGLNCGPIADGCGGIISCGGACVAPQTCGGGGASNVCGGGATCTGLCTQQTTCPGGGTTSISGTVTTPNGTLPIYGALVYVPNGPVLPFTTGVQCDQCGASASGSPLVSTTTGPDGKFLLPNVPVSSAAAGKVTNIPVVIQLGRWRKQFTIVTTGCTNTIVPAASTALPHNKAEGDIPLTAISTGQVDGLECVFRKIGIDDAEFTDPSGNGRIRFYQDNGAVISAGAGTCSVSGAACGPAVPPGTNFGSSCGNACSLNGSACSTAGAACNTCSLDGSSCNTGGTACRLTCSSNGSNCASGAALNSSCNGGAGTCKNTRGTCTSAGGGTCTAQGNCTQTTPGTPPASTLYNDPNELAKYDMTLFECVGGEQTKAYAAKNNVLNYANAGGRVYATHFSYVWLDNQFSNTVPTPASWGAGPYPWSTTATWLPGTGATQQNWATVTASLDTTFAKGQAFAQWLNIVGGLLAPLPAGAPPWTPNPQISISEARHNVDDPVVSPALRWLYTTAADTPNVASVQHYTFNTDMAKPAAQQCGRVLYSDFHVSTNSSTTNIPFPRECCAGNPGTCPVGSMSPLSTQEKVLAFMLFDLASCVSVAPPPAVCTPKTCVSQGIECGQAGDGCGNIITCPDCTGGLTCGGGGVPSKCGKPPCTAKTCAAGQCGLMADGCGLTLNCGACATGTCGGGGTAGVCGVGTCTPGVCPAPAAGSACGPVADGCGGLAGGGSCPCPAGTPCVNGKCGTPPCTPRTCATAGANCGQVADGCGLLLDCGACLAPQVCGGGGTANVCGGGVN